MKRRDVQEKIDFCGDISKFKLVYCCESAYIESSLVILIVSHAQVPMVSYWLLRYAEIQCKCQRSYGRIIRGVLSFQKTTKSSENLFLYVTNFSNSRFCQLKDIAKFHKDLLGTRDFLV